MGNFSLKIGWFYPDLMSTYGDRGNIFVLKKRAEWRGIEVEVVPITLTTKANKIRFLDLLFMGGAQDRQQEIIKEDLSQSKGQYLREAIERNIPGLFICGAYQFMGKYYKAANGNILPGLSIFDLYTEHPGEKAKRLIGDIITETDVFYGKKIRLVGFENHGGRTYLAETVRPFGQVIVGSGNNGKDGSEGVIYNNTIGTYLHGPILPKNPQLADYLISEALYVKYGEEIKLSSSDLALEKEAKKVIFERFGI